MTCLPTQTDKKLGLVIDLDTCVGCQACVTACKEWNTGGHMAPLTDTDAFARTWPDWSATNAIRTGKALSESLFANSEPGYFAFGRTAIPQ